MTIVLVFNGNQLSKRSKKEHMVWVCGLYISMHFHTESLSVYLWRHIGSSSITSVRYFTGSSICLIKLHDPNGTDFQNDEYERSQRHPAWERALLCMLSKLKISKLLTTQNINKSSLKQLLSLIHCPQVSTKLCFGDSADF